MTLDLIRPQLHIDISPKRINRMRKMERLHPLGQLLSNTMDNKYQIRDLRTV